MCRLVLETCVYFVGNTSTSWNASVQMAVSFTGTASAAIPVRPRCGQVAMGSTQEMVSGPGRLLARGTLGLALPWDARNLGVRRKRGAKPKVEK